MTLLTPKHLTGDVREAFDELVGVLTHSGVIANIKKSDFYGLEIVAVQIARMREAQRGIAKDGLYYKQTNRDGMEYGAWCQHPGVAIEQKASLIIRQWSAKLGLAPEDRAKLAAIDTGDGEELELD